MTLKSAVFLDVTPCNLADIYQSFMVIFLPSPEDALCHKTVILLLYISLATVASLISLRHKKNICRNGCYHFSCKKVSVCIRPVAPVANLPIVCR